MLSHRNSDGDGNKITISDLMWKIACIIPKLNFEIASSFKIFFFVCHFRFVSHKHFSYFFFSFSPSCREWRMLLCFTSILMSSDSNIFQKKSHYYIDKIGWLSFFSSRSQINIPFEIIKGKNIYILISIERTSMSTL